MKVMIFIDGTWLYANTPQLSRVYGNSGYRVDFGKLPGVLAEELATQLGIATPQSIDVVRTYLFGSYARNCDPRDDAAAQSHFEFYDVLKQEYHYEVELYPTNFSGKRLRREDRDPNDPFEPKEKCVDIALASTMLYLAAQPTAYDIAIAVVGDRDFTPMLQHVRRLGKRVAIASIQGTCSAELADPLDRARVKDFDVIWLDRLLDRLEFKYERQQRKCEAPEHKGNQWVWTTYRPRRGQPFYCEECRREHQRRTAETLNAEHVGLSPYDAQAQASTFVHNGNGTVLQSTTEAPTYEGHTLHPSDVEGLTQPLFPQDGLEPGSAEEADAMAEFFATSAQAMVGMVTNKRAEQGYAFVRSANGNDYFFHFTDLSAELTFDDIHQWQQVEFEVKRAPQNGRAGAAMNVRPQKD